MSGTDRDLDSLIDILTSCSIHISEAHLRLEEPETPEDKADLLLTVEQLTGEVLELLRTTKRYVWGESDI